MKKLLLLLLIFAAMGGAVAPSLGSLMGFAPTVAHAGNDDSQGDNDNQGENDDEQ